MNFIFGNRAIFISAPIMWFGVAFLLTKLASFITSHVVTDDKISPGYLNRKQTIAVSVAGLLGFAITE